MLGSGFQNISNMKYEQLPLFGIKRGYGGKEEQDCPKTDTNGTNPAKLAKYLFNLKRFVSPEKGSCSA